MKGRLPATYWDWAAGASFSFGRRFFEAAEAAGAAAGDAATPKPRVVPDASASGPEGGEDADMAADLEADLAAAAKAAALGLGPPPAVTGVDLEIPFRLRSADDLQTPFSNYAGLALLLDFVWYQEQRMAVRRYLPMPTEEELGGFIPNSRFGSDHLPVSGLQGLGLFEISSQDWCHLVLIRQQ